MLQKLDVNHLQSKRKILLLKKEKEVKPMKMFRKNTISSTSSLLVVGTIILL